MKLRSRLAIVGLYVAAAVLLTWPLTLNLTTRLGASDAMGDPHLNLWILGWGLRAWTTDPGGVLSGAVFDANIFHPAALTLTYSDHLLLQSLALTPVYLATSDVVFCYNLLLLASLAASGLAMHLLVRSVTGSTAAAVVVGLAWACWPYRTAHLIHLQLQALYLFPLVLWALHRVAAGRRWRDAALLALLTALQALSSAYYGVMLVVALPVAAAVLAWGTGQWRSRRYWTRVIAAGALAGVLVAPVALVYRRSGQAEGFGRTMVEATAHSAAVQSYTQVSPDNLVYGRTGLLAPRQPGPGQRNRTHVEHQMFPGVVLLVLAGVGLWRAWRSDARAVAMTAAALVVTGGVVSFGPDGARTVYAWLYANAPGFEAIRAPARFGVVAMLGLCVLAALALSGLAKARHYSPAVASGFSRTIVSLAVASGFSRTIVSLAVASGFSRTIVVAIAALMMIEYINRPLPLAEAPARTTEVGQWLARASEPGAVLHLPLGIDRENTPFMVQSLEHWRPIVNGYSGQRPGFFPAVVDAISTLPSPEAFAMLRELDVAFVVSSSPIAGTDDAASPLVTRATVAGGTIYEVRWTAESEAALAAVSPPPPPPGPIPFRPGEESRYEVTWVGGPLDVPAGTITLRVATPDEADRVIAPDASWVFEGTAVTAPWVSPFFEANDRLRTLASASLEPLVQTREIHEGRRHLERAYVYDAERGQVRVADTPANAAKDSALGTPLAPGARDVLATLFYARTIDLGPGMTIDLPVNENGRSLSLHLTVTGQETLATPSGPRQAIRLDPTVSRRVERRRPVRVTVWLSADDRRVPLAIDIDAGFGHLRAVLVD